MKIKNEFFASGAAPRAVAELMQVPLPSAIALALARCVDSVDAAEAAYVEKKRELVLAAGGAAGKDGLVSVVLEEIDAEARAKLETELAILDESEFELALSPVLLADVPRISGAALSTLLAFGVVAES